MIIDQPVATEVFHGAIADITAIDWQDGREVCTIKYTGKDKNTVTAEVSLAEMEMKCASFERLLRVASLSSMHKKPEYQARDVAEGLRRLAKRVPPTAVSATPFFIGGSDVFAWGDVQKLEEFKPRGLSDDSDFVSWSCTRRDTTTSKRRTIDEHISRAILEANFPGLDALLRATAEGGSFDSAPAFRMAGLLLTALSRADLAKNAASFASQLPIYMGLGLPAEQQLAMLLGSVSKSVENDSPVDLPQLDAVAFNP